MTRAVSVVVERAPGGGCGWNLRVGPVGRFMFCTPVETVAWVVRSLRELGADLSELLRVVGLVTRELERKRRVEVTAEVPL